jgi:hypothetical protein
VVKRKIGKKARNPKGANAMVSNPMASAQASPAGARQASKPFSWKAILAGVAALAFVIYYLAQGPISQGPAIPGQPASSNLRAFGKNVQLELVSKFDEPDEASDIKVDATGKVYVLLRTELRLYVDGKRVKSISLKTPGVSKSMTTDGSYLYVTDVDSNTIAKIDKDLKSMSFFKIPAASRLSGIAYSSQNQTLLVVEAESKVVHKVSTTGKILGVLGGKKALWTQLYGFFFDMQVDENGGLYIVDHRGHEIVRVSPETVVQPSLPGPWSQSSWERMAIMKKRVYVNCQLDNRVTVMDMEGNPVGSFKMDAPQMITAGKDGYLYVRGSGSIMKFKPLAEAASKK